jgi:hypothetical protein
MTRVMARLDSLEAKDCNLDITLPHTIDKHRDFALYASGARILPDLTSPTHFPNCGSRFWQWARGCNVEEMVGVNTPAVILAQIRPGNCWAFSGSTGTIGISLADRILISEISIDHSHSTRTPLSYIRAAPQAMTLWGQLDSDTEVVINTTQTAGPVIEPAACSQGCFSPTTPSIQGEGVFFPIANFHYDIHAAQTLQTFSVSKLPSNVQTSFRVVVLQVHSNWGGTSTC